nr:MAG TPA: hypothetical protein [Caudoviricetes sp.]
MARIRTVRPFTATRAPRGREGRCRGRTRRGSG